MARTLPILLLLIILSPSAFAADFDLNAHNIASWSNKDNGISVQLTEEGKRNLRDITQANLNQKIAISVESVIVESPVIHEVIANGNLFFIADQKLYDKILPLLPQKKKDTDVIFYARNQYEVDALIKNFLSSQSDTNPVTYELAQSAGSAVADLNNDGRPEIVLVWTTLGKTYWRNTLTIFSTIGHGYKPIISLPLNGEAKLSSVKDGIIFVDQKIAAAKDPICCPTINKQMKYRWVQNELSEVK